MVYLWVVALYLGFLIAVSIFRSRSVKTQDDFMVAGRAVPTLFLVGTLVCTWIGSGSLFGGAGRAFRDGFSVLWMSGTKVQRSPRTSSKPDSVRMTVHSTWE